MRSRQAQLEDTRRRIVEAAIEAFAELGFKGASTRDIAARAETNQGLITYHFKSKDELWRASTDYLFSGYRQRLLERLQGLGSEDSRELARASIREFVLFSAEHPEFFRMMVEEGKRPDDRMRWLVREHLKPMYEYFMQLVGPSIDFDEKQWPHFMYILIGAGGLIFANAPECRQITGLNPGTKKTVRAHANIVASLLVP